MGFNKIIVSIVTLLAIAGTFTPAKAAVEVSGDIYAGLSSMYLWRGFDLSDGEAVIQGGSDLSAKGFTFSYWSNYDLDTSDVNETDIIIDYSKDINELVSVSLGNIYYMLDGIDDTNELYFGVSLGTLLSPTLTVYYDYDAADETGLFYTLSVGHDFTLNEKMSASVGALVSYNDESDYSVGNYSDFHNYELSASADYSLSEQVSISPYLIFSDALSDDAETAIEDEFVGGINLTLSF